MKQSKQTNKKQGPSTVIQAALVASVDQWLSDSFSKRK